MYGPFGPGTPQPSPPFPRLHQLLRSPRLPLQCCQVRPQARGASWEWVARRISHLRGMSPILSHPPLLHVMRMQGPLTAPSRQVHRYGLCAGLCLRGRLPLPMWWVGGGGGETSELCEDSPRECGSGSGSDSRALLAGRSNNEDFVVFTEDRPPCGPAPTAGRCPPYNFQM